jgi:hypothetical protein
MSTAQLGHRFALPTTAIPATNSRLQQKFLKGRDIGCKNKQSDTTAL